MTNESLIEKPSQRTKEQSRTTTVYSHECPACADPTDETTVSYEGHMFECPCCGHVYRVVAGEEAAHIPVMGVLLDAYEQSRKEGKPEGIALYAAYVALLGAGYRVTKVGSE